jgi:hypothetical protein
MAKPLPQNISHYDRVNIVKTMKKVNKIVGVYNVKYNNKSKKV